MIITFNAWPFEVDSNLLINDGEAGVIENLLLPTVSYIRQCLSMA